MTALLSSYPVITTQNKKSGAGMNVSEHEAPVWDAKPTETHSQSRGTDATAVYPFHRPTGYGDPNPIFG